MTEKNKENNVYTKLQNARVKLQAKKLKKSGQYGTRKTPYFELRDFLPSINEILKEERLCSIVCLGKQYAKLILINSDNPDEKIDFTTLMSSANLPGCHPVQNLGAVQTYLRRYLYENAFEITAECILNDDTGKEKQPVHIAKEQSTAAGSKSSSAAGVCPHCNSKMHVSNFADKLSGKGYSYCGGKYNNPPCKYSAWDDGKPRADTSGEFIKAGGAPSASAAPVSTTSNEPPAYPDEDMASSDHYLND